MCYVHRHSDILYVHTHMRYTYIAVGIGSCVNDGGRTIRQEDIKYAYNPVVTTS